MKDFFKNQFEEFKESTTYTMISEKFALLDPRAKKTIIYVLLALIALFFISLPYSAYDKYAKVQEEAQSHAQSEQMFQEYIAFKEELKVALENIRSNFKLVEATSVQNAIKTFVTQPNSTNLPEEALTNFTESADNQKIMTKIKASFRLDRVNYRHLTTFIKALESDNNGIVLKSLKVTQDSNLDGYLNADFSIEAYSLNKID